jgi:HSP20 family protein
MATKNKEKNGSTATAELNEPNKTTAKAASGRQTATNEQRNLPAERNQQSHMPAQRQEHPLMRLRDEMDSLFDRFFGRWPAIAEWGAAPNRFWDVDVQENDKEIMVRAEAPGFEAKDFEIDISGNTLRIWAEHKQEDEKNEEGFRYSERRYGHFERSIPLPTAVDADKVEARYRNGVLELHLPRTEQAQRRRIEVKQ